MEDDIAALTTAILNKNKINHFFENVANGVLMTPLYSFNPQHATVGRTKIIDMIEMPSKFSDLSTKYNISPLIDRLQQHFPPQLKIIYFKVSNRVTIYASITHLKKNE